MSEKAKVAASSIDSSYFVFFHVALLFVAPFMINVFPGELRNDALMVALVFPFLLFWFSYLVKQFIDPSWSFGAVLGAIFVIAALSLLNAVYGNLSDGTVPVIYTEVPFFVTLLAGLSGPMSSSTLGYIYAGTILTYGAYTYIQCVAIASLFERMYERYGHIMVRGKVRHKLLAIDATVDKSAGKFADRLFFFNQGVGLMVCLLLILAYAILYVYLLVK